MSRCERMPEPSGRKGSFRRNKVGIRFIRVIRGGDWVEAPNPESFGGHVIVRSVGQVNGEDGAAAGVFPGHHLAALRRDEAADDREPEAEAARARRVAALEFPEEPVAHGRRQAGAAVGDGKEDACAGAVEAGGEENRVWSGVWRAALSSRLAITCSMSAASARKAGRSSGTAISSGWSPSRVLHAVAGGVHEIVGVAPVEPRPEGARLQAGLVEEVVDQAVQAPGGEEDFAGELVARGGVGGAQALGGAEEHGERRLEFVRNAVEQRPVEFFRFGEELLPLAGGAQGFALDPGRAGPRSSPTRSRCASVSVFPSAGRTTSTPSAQSSRTSGT
jgi:hypothetical protein